jgi:hypothetical protein
VLGKAWYGVPLEEWVNQATGKPPNIELLTNKNGGNWEYHGKKGGITNKWLVVSSHLRYDVVLRSRNDHWG